MKMDEEEVELTQEQVRGMSLKDLQLVARENVIRGWGKMSRPDLVQAILREMSGEDEPEEPQDEVPENWNYHPCSNSSVMVLGGIDKPTWINQVEEAVARAFLEGWIINNDEGIVFDIWEA